MTSTGVPVASVNRAADSWRAAVSASPDEPNRTVSPSPPPPPPVAPDVAGRLGVGAAERSVARGVRRCCRRRHRHRRRRHRTRQRRARRRRGRRRAGGPDAGGGTDGPVVPWRVPLLVVGQWFGSLLPRITSVGLEQDLLVLDPRRPTSCSTSRRTTCSPATIEGLADARQRHGGEAGGGGVVEAGDGDVAPGHLAGRTDRGIASEGEHVADADQCRWRVGAGEQARGDLPTALDACSRSRSTATMSSSLPAAASTQPR